MYLVTHLNLQYNMILSILLIIKGLYLALPAVDNQGSLCILPIVNNQGSLCSFTYF